MPNCSLKHKNVLTAGWKNVHWRLLYRVHTLLGEQAPRNKPVVAQTRLNVSYTYNVHSSFLSNLIYSGHMGMEHFRSQCNTYAGLQDWRLRLNTNQEIRTVLPLFSAHRMQNRSRAFTFLYVHVCLLGNARRLCICNSFYIQHFLYELLVD